MIKTDSIPQLLIPDYLTKNSHDNLMLLITLVCSICVIFIIYYIRNNLLIIYRLLAIKRKLLTNRISAHQAAFEISQTYAIMKINGHLSNEDLTYLKELKYNSHTEINMELLIRIINQIITDSVFRVR